MMRVRTARVITYVGLVISWASLSLVRDCASTVFKLGHGEAPTNIFRSSDLVGGVPQNA